MHRYTQKRQLDKQPERGPHTTSFMMRSKGQAEVHPSASEFAGSASQASGRQRGFWRRIEIHRLVSLYMCAGLHRGRRLQIGWKRMDLLLSNLPHPMQCAFIVVFACSHGTPIEGSVRYRVEQMTLESRCRTITHYGL